jgi:hypothetical protein
MIFPHDKIAFIAGLIFKMGYLIGLHGRTLLTHFLVLVITQYDAAKLKIFSYRNS